MKSICSKQGSTKIMFMEKRKRRENGKLNKTDLVTTGGEEKKARCLS